jgi:hypothetical protein
MTWTPTTILDISGYFLHVTRVSVTEQVTRSGLSILKLLQIVSNQRRPNVSPHLQ